MVQWLGLHALTAEGSDSVPGQGTKISKAMHQEKKQIIFIRFCCLWMKRQTT